MKTNNSTRLIGAVCVAIALSAVAVLAQTSPATSPANSPATTTSTTTTEDRGEHHDYGWIGLAGLLGLAGLMRKRDDTRPATTYDTTARTDTRR